MTPLGKYKLVYGMISENASWCKIQISYISYLFIYLKTISAVEFHLLCSNNLEFGKSAFQGSYTNAYSSLDPPVAFS